MKDWLKKNASKLKFALSALSSVAGTAGLVLGSIGIQQKAKTDFKYFEKPNHEVVFGNATIWVEKNLSSKIFNLYFASNPAHKTDSKWDGTYPEWYFTN